VDHLIRGFNLAEVLVEGQGSLKYPCDFFTYIDSNQIEHKGYYHVDEKTKQINLTIYGVAGNRGALRSLAREVERYFRYQYANFEITHIGTFDYFLTYQYGMSMQIRTLQSNKYYKSIGTYLPLSINGSRNAVAATVLEGPPKGSIYLNPGVHNKYLACANV
jgi:hypothetical protein